MLPTSTRPLSLLIIFFLHNLPPYTAARPLPLFPCKQLTVNTFLGSLRSGSHVISGMSEIKKNLKYFGYLTSQHYNVFDAQLESAINTHYHTAVSPISPPRRSVPGGTETSPALHTTKKYVYFLGKPRWARRIPMTLTYGFSPDNLIHHLSLSEIKKTFKRAFSKWASVIPVSFVEADEYSFADIKIGFYAGDHGDEEPFDGVLGILAHSFSPESGRFHLDAAEIWAVDFETEKSEVAIDLESVAVHEIGHLLGLAHSPVKEAVMYPRLRPREKKVDLWIDDIKGVQSLYGSNPNFTFGSLLESDTSVNQAVGLWFEYSFLWGTISLLLAACFCM